MCLFTVVDTSRLASGGGSLHVLRSVSLHNKKQPVVMAIVSKYRYRFVHLVALAFNFVVGVVILIRLSKTGHVDYLLQNCGFSLVLLAILGVIPTFLTNTYPVVVK
jgi:hypothetical protein